MSNYLFRKLLLTKVLKKWYLFKKETIQKDKVKFYLFVRFFTIIL